MLVLKLSDSAVSGSSGNSNTRIASSDMWRAASRSSDETVFVVCLAVVSDEFYLLECIYVVFRVPFGVGFIHVSAPRLEGLILTCPSLPVFVARCLHTGATALHVLALRHHHIL